MSTNPTYIFFTSSAESLNDYTLDLDLDDEPANAHEAWQTLDLSDEVQQ